VQGVQHGSGVPWSQRLDQPTISCQDSVHTYVVYCTVRTAKHHTISSHLSSTVIVLSAALRPKLLTCDSVGASALAHVLEVRWSGTVYIAGQSATVERLLHPTLISAHSILTIL
jgi:hypothetical protein